MKITFEKIKTNVDHQVIVYIDGQNILKIKSIDSNITKFLKNFINENKKKKEVIKTIHFSDSNNIKSITIAKMLKYNISNENFEYEAFGGRLLSHLEMTKMGDVSLLIEELDKSSKDYIPAIIDGILLKSYKFEKYKTISRKDFEIKSLKLNNAFDISKGNKDRITKGENVKGVFLTRDLVSEPANVLYPEKFVDFCKVLKKAGVSMEIFDEKKMKKLGMNALLGVSQGSVRPARTMIMKWNGSSDKNKQPIAFIGKGVTFDTGGISIKPSGGMEDMKWDMGGAGVVAGLMYTLALRKAKVNVVGAVGLVENMPDGNAQRPGDIVKSMSGQTIEVLNTDAEGRLVLADVLWYVKEKFKPKLMIDLATLTGAIIVALGDRYAGMFTNSDELADKLSEASKQTNELLWRLPLDKDFDKLLNCPIADMKNITGTRGAGSITAAQFLKRFVGDVDWAHLDIAGVTWSKKGTSFSRPGGTGFGVRLLDNFVKKNYG
mgnify:CR=1 FL=1